MMKTNNVSMSKELIILLLSLTSSSTILKIKKIIFADVSLRPLRRLRKLFEK